MQEISNLKKSNNDDRSDNKTDMYVSIQDRLFWSNEKIYEVRDKLRRMKDIINSRTLDDFNVLENAIKLNNEEEILKYMMDKNFKFFYETEMKKRKTLELILISSQFDLLNKILEDPFYKFDLNYVYIYIKQILHNRTIDNSDGNSSLVLTGIAENNLYNKKLVKFFSWFTAKVKYIDVFKILINKEEEFKSVKEIYRNFETENDIELYASASDITNNAICECLINNLEDLAMYIFFIKRIGNKLSRY